MSFFTTLDNISKLENTRNNIANDVNNAQFYKNEFNAYTSNDPVKKKIAQDRYTCSQQFNYHKLYISFWLFILPMLIIFLCAVISSKLDTNSQYVNIFTNIFSFCVTWAITGFVYIAFMNQSWLSIQYKINNSNTLDVNNCAKDF